jgi:hypothetical protein
MLVAHPAPADTEAPRVSVFAAASLADALQEAADLFTDRTGHEVSLSFAGSAALARQIMLGAPADLYLSADPAYGPTRWRRRARRTGRTPRPVRQPPRPDWPWGRTARPGQAPEGLDLAAILGDGRLAIGLVEAVPAGRYGKAALEQSGLVGGRGNPSGADRQRARGAGAGRLGRGPGGHRLRHRCAGRAPCPCDRRVHGRQPPAHRLPACRPRRCGRAGRKRASMPSWRARTPRRSSKPTGSRSCPGGRDHDRLARPRGMAGRGPVAARRALGHGAQPAVRHPHRLCPVALATSRARRCSTGWCTCRWSCRLW